MKHFTLLATAALAMSSLAPALADHQRQTFTTKPRDPVEDAERVEAARLKRERKAKRRMK